MIHEAGKETWQESCPRGSGMCLVVIYVEAECSLTSNLASFFGSFNILKAREIKWEKFFWTVPLQVVLAYFNISP